MIFSDLEKVLERANHFRKKLQLKEGEGTSWPYTFENGETHFYTINGIKPAEEVEVEIESMFIWLWNLRDYVTKYMVNNGKSKTWVKAQFSADPHLCVCADIANSLKHGGLDPKHEPWSNKNPKLGRLTCHIPQNALGELTFGAFKVDLKVSNSSLVKLEMPILSENGEILGDAFKYLEYCLYSWENIVNAAKENV